MEPLDTELEPDPSSRIDMATTELRSILAASDLSEASDVALRSAAGLARRTGAALHVHHVLELNDQESKASTFQDHVTEAERRLAEQCARVAGGICETASARVEIYEPHLSILERARDVHADLIVMGQPHLEGVAERLLGVTPSDRVIRGATVPCLVVARPFRLPLERVVVALDVTDPADEEIEVAITLARRFGGERPQVSVLHVLFRVPGEPGFELERARLPELLPGVAAAVARADGGEPPVEVVEEVLWGDDVAQAITGYAAEQDAGLIVMGSHGRGAIARALAGSVSAAVVRASTSAVLLIPPAMWVGDREEGDAA